MKEIVEAMDRNVDYLFVSTSTCGTLMGCSSYIQEHGLNTKIIAVDAKGSVTFGQELSQWLIPGHGSGKPSNFLDINHVHEVIHISDEDCVKGCWHLLEKEAILCGGSSGAVISAIKAYAPNIPANSNCVVMLCDRGERYLDTIYDKNWIKKQFPDGFYFSEKIESNA